MPAVLQTNESTIDIQCFKLQPTASCLLARDFENSPEDKVLLMKHWNFCMFCFVNNCPYIVTGGTTVCVCVCTYMCEVSPTDTCSRAQIKNLRSVSNLQSFYSEKTVKFYYGNIHVVHNYMIPDRLNIYSKL